MPLSLLTERIIRTAGRHALEILDLRTICTRPEDFVQEIEPSARGARKLAEALGRAVQGPPAPGAALRGGRRVT